jgi:hypothetical protein
MRVMKNALIVESRNITIPENSIQILEKVYWRIMNDFYDSNLEKEWFYESEEILQMKWLGLKEIEISDSDFFKRYEFFRDRKFFEVIDKEKFLWIKIKYEI